MENPCLTFVTPTLLAGDRSLANVVAHEIAHSWTGERCVSQLGARLRGLPATKPSLSLQAPLRSRMCQPCVATQLNHCPL